VHRAWSITTNLAFADWPSIFPNAACTTALIDRVVHHADILAIEGDSYRRRDAQVAKEARRSKATA
jgi:DNA replication protein DnaC